MEAKTETVEILRDAVNSYRRMIDGTVNQLSDDEWGL